MRSAGEALNGADARVPIMLIDMKESAQNVPSLNRPENSFLRTGTIIVPGSTAMHSTAPRVILPRVLCATVATGVGCSESAKELADRAYRAVAAPLDMRCASWQPFEGSARPAPEP